MPKLVNFFPRQTLMGGPAASGTYYSDIFDASDAQVVNPELRIYTASGLLAACTATVEQNDDPAFPSSGWIAYGSPLTLSGINTTTGSGPLSATMPRRFLRAKLEVQPASYMVVHFNVRTFCG